MTQRDPDHARGSLVGWVSAALALLLVAGVAGWQLGWFERFLDEDPQQPTDPAEVAPPPEVDVPPVRRPPAVATAADGRVRLDAAAGRGGRHRLPDQSQPRPRRDRGRGAARRQQRRLLVRALRIVARYPRVDHQGRDVGRRAVPARPGPRLRDHHRARARRRYAAAGAGRRWRPVPAEQPEGAVGHQHRGDVRPAEGGRRDPRPGDGAVAARRRRTSGADRLRRQPLQRTDREPALARRLHPRRRGLADHLALGGRGPGPHRLRQGVRSLADRRVSVRAGAPGGGDPGDRDARGDGHRPRRGRRWRRSNRPRWRRSCSGSSR